VAYRQLGAVTLATLVAFFVGCGGNTSSAGGSTQSGEQQPPASGDQPPPNKDQAPGSADKPPSSTETPPGSADAPAGPGGTVDVCSKFCDTFDQVKDRCSMGADIEDIGGVCDNIPNCVVPANTPCLKEALDAYDCLLSLITDICSSSEAPPQDPLAACQDELMAGQKCAQAQGGGSDKPNNGSGGTSSTGSGGSPPTGSSGSSTTGCASEADDACSLCICNAGTDVTKLSACQTACTAP